MNLEEIALRAKVILSANRALLGAVTPNLRGVTLDYIPELLTLRAYFDIDATDEEKELIDIALTEMIADLYYDIKTCKYEPVELAAPAKLTVLKDWIYLRYEKPD
jgi:hypothetical protein